LHPSLKQFMEEGEIDYHVLSKLEDYMAADTEGLAADSTLMLSPIFEAMFDCNIVFKSKYGQMCRLQDYRLMRLVVC